MFCYVRLLNEGLRALNALGKKRNLHAVHHTTKERSIRLRTYRLNPAQKTPFSEPAGRVFFMKCIALLPVSLPLSNRKPRRGQSIAIAA
jgi:hypothetical protein